MKHTKKRLSTFTLFVLISFSLVAQEPPWPEWKAVDWAPVKPLNSGSIVPTVPQTQDESGEDWWYGHTNIYDANDKHIGYMAVGYATWIEKEFITTIDCQNHTLTDASDLPNCRTLEIDGRRFGVTRETMARYDLSGKMIWCKAFNLGVFFNVIQTKNKDGFVAIGESSSATDMSKYTVNTNANNVDWLKYNPTLNGPVNTFSACQGYDFDPDPNNVVKANNHMNIIKVDNDGNVIWNHLYGSVDYNNVDDGESAAANRSIGEALVEGPYNNLRCVGSAQDKVNDPAEKRKVFIIDVDVTTGNMNWKLPLYGTNGTHDAARAIAISPTHNTYAVTGFWGLENATNPSTHSRAFVSYFYPTTIATNPIWTRFADEYDSFIGNQANATSWSVDFDHDNNIFFSVLANMTGSPLDVNLGADGRIITLPAVTAASGPASNARNPVGIGKVRAYDLRMGVTATSNNGMATVSSKVLVVIDDESMLQSEGVTFPRGTTPCAISYPWESWNSDAYVAKYQEDAQGNWELLWDRTFDTNGDRALAFPGDIKKQECLYQITEADDRGLVISGNTSDNFDDDYLVKLAGECTWEQQKNDPQYFDNLSAADPEYLEIPNGVVVTWSGNKRFKGRVVIKPGGRLEIKPGAVIEFADSRKVGVKTDIIVEVSGELSIENGARLTSLAACSYVMWDGIEVWGIPTITGLLQGKVIMDNSTIEHARNGVYLGKTEHDETFHTSHVYGFGGGTLQADNATFRNCRVSVFFAPFQYSRSHVGSTPSYIKSSTFICDAPLNDLGFTTAEGERLGINYFIGLWDNHGVDLLGNEYKVTHNFPEGIRGTGISSYNATYNLDCLNPSNNGDCNSTSGRSVFEGLQYGIRGSANVTYASPRVNGADFTNTTHGIFLNGVTYADITRNDFDIGIANYNSCFGLYLYNCNKYLVEDNDFTSQYDGNIGINIHNSSPVADNWTNEIYRNRFSGMAYGIFGNGYNRGNNVSRGLKIRCNNFSQGDYDILTTTGKGISGLQGSYSKPAGNLFDGCSVANGELFKGTNNPQTEWDYWHFLTTVTVPNATCYNSGAQAGAVDLHDNGQSYSSGSCPERFVPKSQRRVIKKGEFNTAHQNMLAAQSNHASLIDGGATSTLIGLIEADAASTTIVQSLLPVSPYLSDQVMLSLMNDKPTRMPEVDVVTILTANQPLTDAVINSYTSNYTGSVPSGWTDPDVTSARERLEADLWSVEADRSLALDELIRAYVQDYGLIDSLFDRTDSAFFHLEAENNDESDAALISMYTMTGDYVNAGNKITSLRANENWTSFCDVQQVMLDLYSNGKSELTLQEDAEAKATLDGIASDFEESGSMDARVALEFVFDETIDEIIVLPAPGSSKLRAEEGKEKSPIPANTGAIQIFPNPSSGLVYIDGLDQEAETRIYLRDLSGRILLERLDQGKKTVKINVGDLATGVYLLEINNGSIPVVQKLVKSR